MAGHVSLWIGAVDIGLGRLYLTCSGFSMVIMRDRSDVSTFRQLHGNTFEKIMSAASVVMVFADYRINSEFWMGRFERNADSC